MAEGELPVDEKASHQTVRYIRPSNVYGERCGNCGAVVKEVPVRCKTVASPIFNNGWCRRWHPVGEKP